MQDCTNIISGLTDTLYVGEIIVKPKTELVLPAPVDMATGEMIQLATLEDMPDMDNEDAARRLIEKQNAA